MDTHYDYIVIGSGFGGSVSTMRLAEKGYKVLCIEQGKKFEPGDYAKSNWRFRKYLWWPSMGMYGIQKLSFYPQASILTGAGVGGGSLVYANTLFYPKSSFFKKGPWAHIKDWEKELKPFYKDAGYMMGRTKLDRFNYEDKVLEKIARKMGREESFENVYVGVNLNRNEQPVDPYFNDLGPKRNACVDCAACMVGCRENAKNTLDKNYLYFAEMFGAEIKPETRVKKIEFIENRYLIHSHNIRNRNKKQTFVAAKIILSAGTLGSLSLLLRQKFKFKTLPHLSATLGENLLTNSETLCAVSSAHQKLNNGVAISSVFHPDDNTSVEIVKYPDKSNALKWFFSLAAEGAPNSFLRITKLFAAILKRPGNFFKTIFNFNWSTNLIIFLVMQDLENSMKMKWTRTIFGGKMKIENKGNKKVPAYIEIGQKVMKEYAKEVDGIAQNIILEILFNRPTTAHILGGSVMGDKAENSLINSRLEVHNYPGMYVIDGSVIQSNPGVNPSYSILAIAEYAMAGIKPNGNKGKSLKKLINEKGNKKI